ncbi:hypothetical protein HDU76_002008 [Blyttiomyces sp. JEL0837]|nr:hypothetical protein HDU76_002008 [Blyttiomyces sp. JEL0837]
MEKAKLQLQSEADYFHLLSELASDSSKLLRVFSQQDFVLDNDQHTLWDNGLSLTIRKTKEEDPRHHRNSSEEWWSIALKETKIASVPQPHLQVFEREEPCRVEQVEQLLNGDAYLATGHFRLFDDVVNRFPNTQIKCIGSFYNLRHCFRFSDDTTTMEVDRCTFYPMKSEAFFCLFDPNETSISRCLNFLSRIQVSYCVHMTSKTTLFFLGVQKAQGRHERASSLPFGGGSTGGSSSGYEPHHQYYQQHQPPQHRNQYPTRGEISPPPSSNLNHLPPYSHLQTSVGPDLSPGSRGEIQTGHSNFGPPPHPHHLSQHPHSHSHPHSQSHSPYPHTHTHPHALSYPAPPSLGHTPSQQSRMPMPPAPDRQVSPYSVASSRMSPLPPPLPTTGTVRNPSIPPPPPPQLQISPTQPSSSASLSSTKRKHSDESERPSQRVRGDTAEREKEKDIARPTLQSPTRDASRRTHTPDSADKEVPTTTATNNNATTTTTAATTTGDDSSKPPSELTGAQFIEWQKMRNREASARYRKRKNDEIQSQQDLIKGLRARITELETENRLLQTQVRVLKEQNAKKRVDLAGTTTVGGSSSWGLGTGDSTGTGAK